MPDFTTSVINPEAKRATIDRRSFTKFLGASAIGLTAAACATGEEEAAEGVATEWAPLPAQDEASQAEITPDAALKMLREGNTRFVDGRPLRRDYTQQIRATASGQYPFAVVLGCIDSRVPVETIFDQGVGDIFTARVAGNVVNRDMLGSMEFACSLAGSKAIMVLGHTACGAVKGAISGARLGNLTGLVEKIEPAVGSVAGERNSDDLAYVNQVAEENVSLGIAQIREQSQILSEMESSGSIAIVGAMYDVSSGKVRFL